MKSPEEGECNRQEYYDSQKKLREAIRKDEKERISKVVKEITESKDPNTIWKIRRRIIGKKNEEYDVVTEDGRKIQNSNEAKEYIASYFETLYQAREGVEECMEWTKEIHSRNKQTEERLKSQNLPEITKEEMDIAIRRLERRKSCGPDEIPNEALIHADNQLRNCIRTTLNRVMKTDRPPESWKKGTIITIYKGKGQKGKCSNERGITLSSNMGKLYERIINNRAKKKVQISDMQGGGKKGANTVDHILTLQELIRKGKDAYITFLDVTKAYDKAWIEGIMYVLERRGLKDENWLKIKQLNTDLKAQVKTKHGLTREIHMKDNIKQGGVLSVLMYATLMDEIAKEIKTRNIGIEIDDEEKIGCLLWMDDVALISKNKEDMQKMLDITDEIAKKYRIKFGKEKSKVMKIGKKLVDHKFYLGDMELEYCEKYKYLGVTLSKDNKQMHYIMETKRKAEAAFNTILAITGNVDFKHIELKAIWKFVETCIIPIITYGGEGRTPNKKEAMERRKILDNIIKRILMVPISTPREPLYHETGMMDTEHIIAKNRITYKERTKRKSNKILQKICDDNNANSWSMETEEIIKEVQRATTCNNPNQGKSRSLKGKVMEHMKEELDNSGKDKSKVKYYMSNTGDKKLGKRAQYLDKLTRQEASAIFNARTRMLKVKANYKNKYRDQNRG